MLLIVALRDLCYQQNALCYWWVQWPLNEYTGNEAATMLKPFCSFAIQRSKSNTTKPTLQATTEFFLNFLTTN